MRRWWVWAGAPVVLGIAAGAVTTLVTDRAWASGAASRCVVFSCVYLAIRPAALLGRRLARRGRRTQDGGADGGAKTRHECGG